MDATIKKRTCMICQPHGIGDILFIQKIVHHFADQGFHVVVPILDKLSWMRAYLAPREDVEYPLITVTPAGWAGGFKFADIFLALHAESSMPKNLMEMGFKTPITYNGGDPETGFIFLALGSSYQWLNDKMMSSKYKFVELDPSDWADHVQIKRRSHVEKELYYDVLGLKDDSRFTLVNENSSSKAMSFNVPGNVVKLRELDGFTLFDWMTVIEKATQIVTIDTSLVLLTEILKQKKPLYIVSRYTPPSFEAVQNILKLDWNFVLTPQELKVDPVG